MAPKNLPKLVLALIAGLSVLAAPAPALAAAPKKTSKMTTEVEAPVPGAVTVSDFEFNTFVFPTPLKRVFFPSGAPVKGKPIYLADNTQVMLQFEKSDKPIQMVAELDNNSVVSLRVVPRPVIGVVHALNGARVASPTARKSTGAKPLANSPRGEDIELLKQLMSSHEPPAGFEPVKLPDPARFDKFSVVPLAAWADGGSKRIIVFSIVAAPGQTAVVAPPQFYRPGISAVMLEGDVADDKTSPQLFVVEELSDE